MLQQTNSEEVQKPKTKNNKRVKVNWKIYEVTDCATDNYNTQYLQK